MSFFTSFIRHLLNSKQIASCETLASPRSKKYPITSACNNTADAPQQHNWNRGELCEELLHTHQSNLRVRADLLPRARRLLCAAEERPLYPRRLCKSPRRARPVSLSSRRPRTPLAPANPPPSIFPTFPGILKDIVSFLWLIFPFFPFRVIIMYARNTTFIVIKKNNIL